MTRITRSPRLNFILCGTALLGSLCAATPVHGQEAGSAAGNTEALAVETITVTARERKEDIQKVPAQVTAFTSEAIENKGVQNPSDFLNAVPNVTFIPTQNAGTSFIVIRGISQARNSEPSAAIVVDGVPMTQPAAFNQQLVDIAQIEVLKGPQGALYGRNAIGGAILITTKQPTDTWEGQFTAGYENGPGFRTQGVISGPLTDTLRMRAAVSYFNTDGHLINVDTKDKSAFHKADPVGDLNARLMFLYAPDDHFTADLRLSMDLLNTRGLYYVVPDFGSPNFNNPNYTDRPISLNNSGRNDRKIYDTSLKLTYDADFGTFTSITGYSTIWEILTGDGYPFDPFGQSRVGFNFDQSQFLTAKTFSQELRFTSPSSERFRWIAGGQIFSTSRFISTGNMYDVADEGVQPVFYTPNPAVFQPQGQISFLADGQNQFAWALYFDTSTNITEALEFSANFRFDSDWRRNVTRTPQAFLTGAGIPGTTGEVRRHTWSAFQPQFVLRYQVDDDIGIYGSWSRGFRSGGFNQTGVATAATAAGFDNVGDMFNAETASTWEAGAKTSWLDGRLLLNGSFYYTEDHNDYYFVFLASNSTQNLGNIAGVRFIGFDLDATAQISQELSFNAGFGYTDSKITDFPGASGPLVVGAKAPLVSDYTLNVGLQWLHPLWDGVSALVRIDDNLIGPTVFVIPVPAAGEPNPIARDPVNLFDLRVGLRGGDWDVTFWSKNLFNKKYNTEYSTGGFLFKGQPMTWGLDLVKRF
jgi:iron complex outermembrane receptor protein